MAAPHDTAKPVLPGIVAPETQLALLVDAAREALIEAAKLADSIGARAVHVHVLNAGTHVDDALTALSEGVPR